MVRKVRVKAKNVDDAVQDALKQLKTTSDRVKIHVLSSPSRGFLGIFSRDAVVEVEVLSNPVEEATRFLRDVVQKFGVPCEIECREFHRELHFQFVGDQIGVYIGHHGETLDSLQHLLHLVANRYSEHQLRVYLDAGGYRKRREQSLRNLAERMAQKVLETGRSVALEPMPTHERKIIHLHLQDHEGVITYSKDDGSRRRLVIDVKNHGKNTGKREL